MIRTSIPFCIALTCVFPAHADWAASAKECAEVIAAQTMPRCGSCAALWPQISKCAADAEGVDPARTGTCINRVNDDNWGKPMYFDRVGAVISCLSK
jgi:hypothetical protein